MKVLITDGEIVSKKPWKCTAFFFAGAAIMFVQGIKVNDLEEKAVGFKLSERMEFTRQKFALAETV